MKRCLKIFLLCIFVMAFASITAVAEEFYASDFSGAEMLDNTVFVGEDTAEIVYEWYLDKSGCYDVGFNNAVCNNCDVTAMFENGNSIKLSDITKTYELAFDAGYNSITLLVTKRNGSSAFSVGTLNLEYMGDIDLSRIGFECNNYAYTDAEVFYYDSFGTDMSQNDVTLYRRFNRPFEVGFMFYAPASGEYSAEIVMSAINKAYTSDVNMCVNGTDYKLKSGTVTQIASLTNAMDSGLMKKYDFNGTVTLKQGINSIVFSSIEMRDTDNLYLFYLDYINFKFMNEEITIDVNKDAKGVYTYPVKTADNAQYYAEIAMSSDGTAMELPDCEISADGVNYLPLTKGTAENDYKDSSVQIVSEYLSGKDLYGVYRLNTAISPLGSVTLKIGNVPCKVEKITLIPKITQIGEVYAVPDKSVLVPGESSNISVFATDTMGYTLNLNNLREKGALVFKTSDRDVLSADAGGNVVAVKPGNAEVTVSAFDGMNVSTAAVSYNIYNENYGFSVIDVKKDKNQIIIKLLSPFVTKKDEHTMVIAEYAGNDMVNAEFVQVRSLNKGQIVTYKHPANENIFKIISLSGLNELKPVYEALSLD